MTRTYAALAYDPREKKKLPTQRQRATAGRNAYARNPTNRDLTQGGKSEGNNRLVALWCCLFPVAYRLLLLISRGDLLLFSLSLSPFSLSFDASVAYEFERRSKLAFLGDAEMTLGFLGICWKLGLGFGFWG